MGNSAARKSASEENRARPGNSAARARPGATKEPDLRLLQIMACWMNLLGMDYCFPLLTKGQTYFYPPLPLFNVVSESCPFVLHLFYTRTTLIWEGRGGGGAGGRGGGGG